MKLVRFSVVFFMIAMITSNNAEAQNYASAVQELNTIYETYSSGNVSEPIVFDSLNRLLVIDNYQIPVSDNTFIQCVRNQRSKGGMKYSAKFYMQQGETITLKGNELIQKSFLSIPLADKESCKAFVFQLEQLKKE